MNRRSFWKMAIGMIAGIFGAKAAEAKIVLPRMTPSTSPPPKPLPTPTKPPSALLREYLGLSDRCHLVHLEVGFHHADIDRLCRVTKAKLFRSFQPGQAQPKLPSLPIEPGYRREKCTISTSVWDQLMTIEVVDVIVTPEEA